MNRRRAKFLIELYIYASEQKPEYRVFTHSKLSAMEKNTSSVYEDKPSLLHSALRKERKKRSGT